MSDALAQIQRLRCALDAIANFDPFQGGPIAPRVTPTESAMRRIACEALLGTAPSGDDNPDRGRGMTGRNADDGITDEMVERAAYPIFVGVAKAPWTSRDDDEPCPVQPFTKHHARNIARVALTEGLRHAR